MVIIMGPSHVSHKQRQSRGTAKCRAKGVPTASYIALAAFLLTLAIRLDCWRDASLVQFRPNVAPRFCDATERAASPVKWSYHMVRPPSPTFLRTFWPDRAEYMVLPGDPRRTGTKCPSRVVDTAHSIVITVVTSSWREADIWRLESMARALRQQSYGISRWWVLIVTDSDKYSKVRPLLRTMEALERYGAKTVHGVGVDLVNALRADVHTAKGAAMPTNVLIDENFNTIMEHAAAEKFVWALEARDADAVSSWSVSFDTVDESQHYTVRTSKNYRGATMMRASDPSFWHAFEQIVTHARHNLARSFICDHRTRLVILPEYLLWEDARVAGLSDHATSADDGSSECRPLRARPSGAIASNLSSSWHTWTRSASAKYANSCQHAASMILMIPWLEYGGADQFNVNLVRNLARPYNIHVVVITTTDGSTQPLLGDVAAVTEDIFHLNHLLPPPHERRNGSAVDFTGVVEYLSATRGADVLLLSNSEPGYSNLHAMRPRLPDVTFVDYVHSVALDWHDGGYARYSIEKQRWLDHTLVSSNKLRAWFRSQGHRCVDGYGSPVVHPVYIGVDTRECRRFTLREKHAVRRRYGVDASRPLIVFPARMSPEKNPGRFFAIAERVVKANPKVTFIAVGGGPLLSALRANISRARMHPNIITTGALTHPDTLDVVSASDVLMLTSNYEGISLSIFEGMSAGVVPFTTDVGAQGELVTPDTGFLIPLDDNVVEAYANEILTLLSKPRTVQMMKAAAHARILTEFDVGDLPVKIRQAICQPVI